jgi:TolB-like protein
VAVLPFVAVSSGENDGYFADGLTEEILNSLAQLPELNVTGRTSSFFFKGKDVPVNEIANLLNVAHIVEGSVRRDGEQLRVTSQLVRAADGFHLWSQTYDRPSDDIFAIQQDIAQQVAEALDVVLDDEARERMRAMRINDVEAFIAYQKGLEYYEKAHSPSSLRGVEGLAIANTYFDTALEAQPDLLAARLLKNDRAGHILKNMIGREEPSIDKVREQLKAYQHELDLIWRASPSGNQRDIFQLERALASDDWTGLSTLIEKALKPGDCPRINSAEILWNLGFANELAKKFEESLACNPLDPDVIFRLAYAYAVAGRPEESLRLLDRAEAAGVISGRFDFPRYAAQVVAGQSDDSAMRNYRTWEGKFYRYLMQGDESEARKIAEQYWDDPDTSISISLELAATVGDRARANEYAARIDKYPGSAFALVDYFHLCVINARLVEADGCRDGVPFDLEVTPNLKARIEESGLQWPPDSFRDASTEAP